MADAFSPKGAKIKNPRPKDVALIDPRGVLKCLCKNQQFSGVLEYWSDGVMENRSYAFFLPEQNTEKRKNIQILLSLPEINTPILHHSNTPGCVYFRQSRQTLTTPTGRGFQNSIKFIGILMATCLCHSCVDPNPRVNSAKLFLNEPERGSLWQGGERREKLLPYHKSGQVEGEHGKGNQ